MFFTSTPFFNIELRFAVGLGKESLLFFVYYTKSQIVAALSIM